MDDDDADLRHAPMPRRLKWVLAFVCLQVVGNLGFGILVHASIDDVLSTGGDLADPTVAYLSEYVSFVTAGALLVAAVAIVDGRAWGRVLLVVLEALSIVSGALTLIGGAPAALAGLVLCALVMSTLFHDAVLSWFDQKAYLRNRG